MSEDRRDESVEEHAGQVQPGDKPKRTPQEEAEKAIVQEVIDNLSFALSVYDEQINQEDEDIEFEDGTQWTEDALGSREEQTDEVTGRKTPGRPAITTNLVEQRVQQIVNEAREAQLSLSVTPKAGWSNTKQAGYLKGLIRTIQSDSGAGEVRLWSLERTVTCGRGFYEVTIDYANDGDFDADIIVSRILDQSSVYLDPYHRFADARDAGWGIITDVLSEEDRLRQWPTKPLDTPEGAFEDKNNRWFSISDGKKRQCRVARYYKVVPSKKVLAFHHAIGKMQLDEMPEQYQREVLANAEGTRMREVGQRVLRVVVDGTQVLERGWWLGREIPIIPTIGKEKVVKGKRKWKGVVNGLKDLNRGYNVAISSAVETAAKMPRAEYIMYEGQDEGYEEMWDDSPIKNYNRLYIKNVMLGDKSAPLPQRQHLEPELQGSLLLARSFKDDIASQSGQIDAARAINPYARSGKFVEALQRQGAAGTSNYLDNLGQISMMREGRVIMDLAPKVYDRPGRIISVMGEEKDDETAIMIRRPFVHDEEGNPIPVPCPQCQGKGAVPGPKVWWSILQPAPVDCPACKGDGFARRETMPKEWNGQKVEYVDLSDGQFKLTVSIGRNFQNKQDEAMAAMAQLAEAAPALVPVYADLWVRATGFSGANEIADRIKKHNPYAGEDKGGAENMPPELMQRFKTLYAEHQEAMAELQKLTEILRSDAQKIHGQKEIAQMKAEAEQAIEHLRQQGKILAETDAQKGKLDLEAFRGDLESMRQESEHRHEIVLQLLKELGAKEIERHKANLHNEAAEIARREIGE